MSRWITSHDPLQEGYRYELTEPEGRLPQDFQPDLTPAQMLSLGVFGGNYFDGHTGEYPAGWFAALPSANFFGVSASQPLSVWQSKGWIHPLDPRGWFQWYCRYYLGRRLTEEDNRQIRRWRAMRRHVAQVKAHCAPGDLSCRPRQRQALLQWAYDSRKI